MPNIGKPEIVLLDRGVDNMYLAVEWAETVELLEIDLRTIQKKKTLKTEEHWPAEEAAVDYQPRVRVLERRGSNAVIHLEYEPSDHPELIAQWGRQTISWGTSELRLTGDKVEATWHEDGESHAAKVRVLDAPHWEQYRKVVRTVKQRTRQQKLRKELLALDGQCAITGEKVKAVLEAAHISAHREDGRASPRNGFLLRADLHKLFDAKDSGAEWLRIDASGRVELSPKLSKHKLYAGLANTQIGERAPHLRIYARVQRALREAVATR